MTIAITTDETSADGVPDSVEAIPALREQIDELDAEIVELVGRRVQLSKRIQAARINGGGTRVALNRERVIMDAYRAALGRSGAHLAEAVLEVCRGQR